MNPTTHAELVEVARRWLASRCPVVITEMAHSGMETADAIGWTGWGSILIECKASRADFMADKNKAFRRNPSSGMGIHRYYLAPAGLIQADDLPAGWGLLEVVGSKVKQAVKSEPQDRQSGAEIGLLVSCIRRIGQTCPRGVSVKCYTISTANTASLTVEPTL